VRFNLLEICFVFLKELKDENGRLRKLLAEKDYEVGYLRRIQEEERQAFIGKVSVYLIYLIQDAFVTSGANTVGGDAIASKVVELSKKNRELCAELESERAKLKKLSIKCKELESIVKSLYVFLVIINLLFFYRRIIMHTQMSKEHPLRLMK